jgi:hypothetical protein
MFAYMYIFTPHCKHIYLYLFTIRIGFENANMSPLEFKDMIMKTFCVSLSGKELGAMARYYEVQGRFICI